MTEANAPKPASIKQVTDFFRTPGDSLSSIAAEWKALPEKDKNDLKKGIGDGTLNY